MDADGLKKLTEAVETPCFIYDLDMAMNRLGEIREAFGDEAGVFYSYKANTALGRPLYEMGCGLQVTSIAHAREALEFANGERILFNGRTLTERDAAFLIESGIHIIVNSWEQVETIKRVQRDMPIGIRIDTGIVPDAEFRSSSLSLGVPPYELVALGANIVGIHNHLASQNRDVCSYRRNAERIMELARKFNAEYLDIGGGFPIRYGEDVPSLHEFSQAYAAWPKKLYAEPGRFLVGPAGVLCVEVKEVDGDHAIVDASVFGSVRDRILSGYKIQLPLHEKGEKRYKILGNTPCSVDVFGEYDLPELRKGDRLAFLQAGAYCVTKDDFAGSRPPTQFLLRDGILQGVG